MWGKKDCPLFSKLTSDTVEVVLLPVMQSLLFKADIVSALLISFVSDTVMSSVVVVVVVVIVVVVIDVVVVVVVVVVDVVVVAMG